MRRCHRVGGPSRFCLDQPGIDVSEKVGWGKFVIVPPRFFVGVDLDPRIDLFPFGESKYTPTILSHVGRNQWDCIGDVTSLPLSNFNLRSFGVIPPMGTLLGAIGVGIAAVTNLEYSSAKSHVVCSFRPSRIDVWIFLTGCMAMVAIKAIGVFGLFTFDFPMIGEFKHYLIDQDQYDSLERINRIKKAGLLALMALVSEIILGSTANAGFNKVRSLRRRMLLFLLPLAVYPEIFSRVIIIYWISELIFIVGALSARETRIRMSGAFVFSVYGIAPNAINVIIGPGWLYAL